MLKMGGSAFLFFLLCFSSVALAEQKPATESVYVTLQPVVNMYSQPTKDSEVISQAIYGTNVILLENKGDWGKVRTADQYTGWVHLPLLRKVQASGYATNGRVVRVAQLSANIYRDQDVTKHEPIVTVPWETRLELIEEGAQPSARWLKLRLPDGGEGYIQHGDVSLQFDSVDIPASIGIAKRFLGVTYTWGGTSSWGYDCSGFTQMIVRQRGILMPRDADQQMAWSGNVPVERKDLQAGDLLFFGSSPSHVTHTGMYIGNGQFIHDTTHEHPMVQISNLDDAPWTTLLVAARRVK